MAPDWFEARRAASVGKLDEYLASFSLTVEQKTTFAETLSASASFDVPKSKPEVNATLSGIYSHYLSHLLGAFSNSEFDPEKIVEDVDGNVRDTIDRLFLRNPQARVPAENRPGYGLVIGRIQSGKTAHLIGLILHSMDSKESDVPYDTVIVLSGLIEDLRKQTTERMKKSVSEFAGVQPKILPGEESDLSTDDQVYLPQIKQHFKDSNPVPTIIVIKKNHIVLEVLRECLPSQSKLTNRRILIIDDEADHASMDTGGDVHVSETGEDPADEDPSETNRQLRLLVKQFQFAQSCWYIGYTATPFANLLSHPWSSHAEDEHGLSLHPRDMLHALSKPRGHFDNEQYFLEPDCPNVVIEPELNERSEEERHLMRKLISRHILTNEIKRLREIDDHHTTLIHTAIEVEEHRRIAQIVRDIKSGYFSDPSNAEPIYRELLNLAKEYTLSDQLRNDLIERLNGILLLDFDKFTDILDGIGVVEVNRRKREEGEDSTQDLDYSFGPRSLIAIGGTRLSRGLTLQGLTTSWFSRRASEPKYDTMLQMARWCGYRPHYSDLVRILTTEQIRMDFVRITNEEHDLRRKIQTLPSDADPLQEEIWIREHPGMHLTSPEKKQHAVSRMWGGLSRSTLWSYDVPELGEDAVSNNKNMHKAAKDLLSVLRWSKPIEPKNKAKNFHLYTSVNGDAIKSYLSTYHGLLSDGGVSDTKQHLRNLLAEEWPSRWNVGLHTPGNVSKKATIHGMKIGLVNRSTTQNNTMRNLQNSAKDTTVDLEQDQVQRTRPLLLLYLVDPESTQGNKGKTRVFHQGVKKPVSIFGICLPTMFSEEGGTEYTADKQNPHQG